MDNPQKQNMLPGAAISVLGVAEDSSQFNETTDAIEVDQLFCDLSKRTADMLNAADNLRESIGRPRMYEDVITALDRCAPPPPAPYPNADIR